MCKKSLLMMLLLALFAPWAAKAQSVPYEVQIGEGTSTSGYFPFYTLYNYSIAENLFLASELEEAGVLPGQVTSLSWYATNAPGYEQQGISIWMANVDDEALTTTSHVTTDMTLVYTGSVTPAVGWNEFLCEEDTFIWDGTSNILIFCQRNNGDWNSTVSWQATTGFSFNAMAYRYQDSGAYDVTIANTMYTSTTRPNIIIKGVGGGGTGPTCARPSTLDVTDITGIGATCTWENTGAASYTFEWKKASDSDYTVVSGLTANTYALSSLEPMTAYSVRVKAVCDTDLESTYKTANFTTLEVCPDGKVCIGAGTATNSYLPTYNYYNYSYTQQIYTADEIGEAALIESVDIYSVGSVTRNLEIYMVNTEKMTFDSVTDWIPATEGDLVFSGSVAFAANSWNTMEFDNPFIYDGRHNVVLIVRDITGSYVSSINFFVFDAQGNQAIRAYRDTPGAYDITAPGVSGTLLGVKNRVRFGVSEMPSCFQPTGLTVSDIEARQAVLSWNQYGEATAWQIGYQVVGGTEQYVEVSTNPYTLTGLTPETDYQVRVQSKCSDTEYSTFTNFVSFTTEPSCYAPTGLAVSDITAFTANVNWTGTETTHQLRYVANPPMFFQGYVTDPGAMADGSDASWTHNGSTTWGPSANLGGGYMLADDFTVNTATALTEIEVYGYQTGSTTESTFTGLYAVIYDGNPSEESSNIVWGDMETNIMTSTSFTNCYRGSDGETTATTRPIMAITASGLNIELEPGTYWLAYGLTGTMSSGPWGVPYSDAINGNIGDGLQYSGSAWGTLNDSGTGAYGPAMKLMFGDMEAFDWTYANNIEASTYALTNLDPETDYLVQVRATCGGNDGNSEWASATFTTLPTCLTPTALSVSNIEARQVVLSWTENGDATAWEIDVNGTVTAISQNPYTLTGLEPSTRYTVKVRANCGDGDYSDWSQEVTFTTDLSCYPPTNLTVSDITATAATLGWTSTNDNFDVWYRPLGAGATLEYNFEEGMSGWTTIDADNDGYDWVLGSQCGGVYLEEGGSLAGTGHNGSEDMMCSGSYSNYTAAALTPDNYLVSPQVTLGGSITFWAQAQDGEFAAEHFGVAVSTTGNTDAADFTTIQEWTMTAKGVRTGSNIRNVAEYANNNQVRGGNRDQGTWYEFTVDLSEYSGQGYVAIRHFDCTDWFILNVDDIAITLPGDVPYEWVEVSTTDNPYTITGLDPETTYEARVRSNCGAEDGVSTWVHTTFTTLDLCNTPENLTAIDSLMTAYTATLTWHGIQDSYNLRYGVQGELTAFFREDFAEGIPADWTNDATYPWTVTDGYIQSSNAGVGSSTSAISITATYDEDGVVEFDAECRGEGTSTVYDKCIFEIDGVAQFTYGAQLTSAGWLHYSFEVAAGEHTFTWKYTKDSSVNPTGDYFAIDNVVMSTSSINWAPIIEGITEMPYTLTGLERTTEYYAQVQGVCPSGLTEWSNMVSFTTTVSCWQPTQLVVTDVMPDEAVIAWTANGEETAWDIEVSDLSQTPAAVTNWTAITENPFTLPGLFEQTDYSVRVRANCGSVDGESEWSEVVSFTTLGYCDMPEDLEIGDITFYTATASWTGIQESYNLKYWKHEVDAFNSVNFADGIPADWTNDATYPWTVVNGYIQSSNAGVSSSTSAISATATFESAGTIEFDAECRGEGTSTAWDKCIFEIDGEAQFTYGAQLTSAGWLHYSFNVAAGEHTFTWKYTKDSNVNPTGDYFAVDNVVMGYIVEPEYIIVENIQDTAYIFTDLEYEATYFVQVQGMDAGCTAGTEWTDAVSFVFPMPVQTIELVEGWNWFSLYIDASEDPIEMLQALEAALGDNAEQIMASEIYTEYEDGVWFGDLDDYGLTNEQTYMIYVTTPCTIQIEGMPTNVEEYTIEINPDWNWIGFPSTMALDINEALIDFEAEEEDMIQTSTEYVEFSGEWFGDFATLEPGQGYMYFSNSEDTKYLTFTTGAKAFRGAKKPVKVKVTCINQQNNK